MQCIISTLSKTYKYNNITSVTIPIKNGIAQIKPGHAEYITDVVEGNVLCVTSKQRHTKTQIQKGVCRVINDVVTIVI